MATAYHFSTSTDADDVLVNCASVLHNLCVSLAHEDGLQREEALGMRLVLQAVIRDLQRLADPKPGKKN